MALMSSRTAAAIDSCVRTKGSLVWRQNSVACGVLLLNHLSRLGRGLCSGEKQARRVEANGVATA